MSILEISNISKSYVDFKAVDDVSFSVNSGSIYGMLGPNGAGKTTTIRMIMNIIIPDKGDITIFGDKMTDQMKNRIGYLPEERGLYPKMTVLDILIFFGELQGMKKNETIEKSKYWLNKLEISEWESNKVEELSKGMQQKIQFIATIMHDPEIVILDEPFSGLDPINVQLLKNIILDLKKEGKAILFSTHMMDTAEKICDEILLINKSKKVLDGDLLEIKKEHGTNSIQIEYDGDGQFIKNLSEIISFDDYGNYLEVKLEPSFSTQEFLKLLVDKIEVRRFQTMESSLNDIFIEIAGGNNNG